MHKEPLRVLLIDDEQSLRDPLAKRLRNKYNYYVDAAADAHQAWQLITKASTPYDVALIDDMLTPQAQIEPQLIGIDFMNRIREEHPETECILFTGWGMERALEGLRAGAYRYLAKPINPEELAMTIRMAAEHRRLKQQLKTTRQEKKWLQTFLEIGRATASVLELDEVLEHVHTQISLLMDASCMDVVLYDSVNRTLKFELGYDKGVKEAKWERPFTADHGLTDLVIQHRHPLLIRDYKKETPPVLAYQRGEMSRSWLGVPLIARDQVIGAITVQSYTPRKFDETDQQILDTVANHIASVIQNAQLFSELVKTQKWREALINNTLDAVIAIDQGKRVTVFNQRAEQMFGWQAREIIGQPVTQLHMSAGKAKEIFDTVNHEGEISSLEVELKHRDGTAIPARLSATRIKDSNGHPIGQARFMRDLRQVNLLEERLRALIRGNRVINSSLELEQVLNQVIQAALEAFPMAQGGVIHLYDENSSVLRLQANTFSYSPSAIEALHMKPGEGIAGWVYMRGQPVVIPDAHQDKRYKLIAHPEIAPHKPMVCVPLKVRDQVLGTLSLNTVETGNTFQAEDLGLLATFADQAAVAIHNARFFREQDRRQQLLTRLNEASRHIRAEKPIPKLLHEIVRQAVRLVDCSAGALFLNRPHVKELELQVTYELPTELVGSHLSHTEGLVGLVARTGKSKFIRNYSTWSRPTVLFEPYNLQSVAGIPLKQSGEVQAVLLVANRVGTSGHLQPSDLEILERLAAQAAIELKTSLLMSREQRAASQLGILHQISDYIQAARDLDKVLHVVLTGVTAGYGLGFNRAALLLLDARRENLVGRMGIGQLTDPAAQQDWEQHHKHKLEDFQRYLELLEKDALPLTPVGERIRDIRLPLTPQACGILMRVMRQQQHLLLTLEDLNELPGSFVKAFDPAQPIIVAPLLARGAVIGLLIADNKFTASPITPEDTEALLTFANTAAVAISNAQLYHETRVARERLRSFYEASNALVSSQDPEQVLHKIVEQAHLAAGSAWTGLILIDKAGQAQKLVTMGIDEYGGFTVRPDGISMQAMCSGQAQIIEDVQAERERVNPGLLRDGIGAALCLPLSLQENHFGVMWLHYAMPRHFPISEVEALQLYVNQAAIAYDAARRMQQLENMRRAAEALAGASSIPAVLKQIAESARIVLNADSSVVWPYDHERRIFLPAELETAGISPELVEQFRDVEPQPEGTTETVLHLGWIGVSDVDQEVHPFLGPPDRGLRGAITVQSFQGVALRAGDEILGVLYADYERPRSFNKADHRLAETFATHASLALKKARLLDQISQVRDTAKAVAEVSILEKLASTLDSITRGTCKTLNCDAVTLYTFDQRKDQIGFPPTVIGIRDTKQVFELGFVARNSVVGKILDLGQVHVAEDAPSDPIMGGVFVKREGIKSSLGVPLQVGDQKVGVMFVNYRTPHRFTGEELTNIKLFATQAAIAIRNARLVDDIFHRNIQLQTVTEVSKSTSTLLAPEALMHQAVNLIRERFELYYVGLFLTDESGKHAVLRAGTGDAGQRMLTDGYKLEIDDHSMIGWSINNAHPRITLDVDKEKIRFNNPHLPETHSELALPLISRGRGIGALTVQSTRPDAFSSEDVAVLQTMADQLAIAIENAQLYREETEQLQESQALQKIAISLAGSLELGEVLNHVMQAAMGFTETDSGTILLWNAEQENFTYTLTTTGPERTLQVYTSQTREEGIARTIIEEQKTVIISNAQDDPRINPIAIEKGRRALIGTPLVSREEVIGVLYVSSLEPRQFLAQQVSLLKSLASQAAVAIERARQHKELKETKSVIGARTALAWMGMTSSAWRHTIEKHSLTIREQAQLLRQDWEKVMPHSQKLKAQDRIAMIERLTTQILQKPITPPLSSESGVQLVSLTTLVSERARQLWQSDPYKKTKLQLDLQLPEEAAVRTSPEWLRRAFDILVDNAVNAVTDCPVREITIGTKAYSSGVKVFVSDTGPGIPDEMQDKIGLEAIEKPKDAKGLGMGLLIAHVIVQTYGGEIWIDRTGPTGTTMSICLPLEAQTREQG